MTLPPSLRARVRRVSEETLQADLRRARELDVLVAVELQASPAAVAALAVPARGKGLDRQKHLERALVAAQEAGEETGRAVELLEEASALRWRAANETVRVARQEARKCAHNEWSERELIQIGLLGLYEGAKRFDAARGVKFATFARWWCRAEITRELETKGISAAAHETMRCIRKLEKSLGRAVSDAEASEYLGETPERIADVRAMHRVAQLVSLDAMADDDNGDSERPLVETLAAPETDGLDNFEIERLHALVDALPEASGRLLSARFGLGAEPPRTLSQIARGMALSRERVRQLERKALAELRELWEADMDDERVVEPVVSLKRRTVESAAQRPSPLLPRSGVPVQRAARVVQSEPQSDGVARPGGSTPPAPVLAAEEEVGSHAVSSAASSPDQDAAPPSGVRAAAAPGACDSSEAPSERPVSEEAPDPPSSTDAAVLSELRQFAADGISIGALFVPGLERLDLEAALRRLRRLHLAEVRGAGRGARWFPVSQGGPGSAVPAPHLGSSAAGAVASGPVETPPPAAVAVPPVSSPPSTAADVDPADAIERWRLSLTQAARDALSDNDIEALRRGVLRRSL